MKKKGKDVRLFFQVWPKLRNWQLFVTMKNRLYAPKICLIFKQIFKNLLKFYKKQVCSLEIEDIFAKMAKMAILSFFMRANSRAVRHFQSFSRSRKILKFLKNLKNLSNFLQKVFFFFFFIIK